MIEVTYRVRPVTRFIITRHYFNPTPDEGLLKTGCDQYGEYENSGLAHIVANAMHKTEPNTVKSVLDIDLEKYTD